MSKEVEEKEVVKKNDKKGNGVLVTVLVVVLLAVFFGLGYGFGGTKIVEKVVTNDSVKNDDSNDANNAFKEIEANSLITNLWNRVNFSGMSDLGHQDEISFDGKKASEMSDTLKGIIASKYYYNTGDYQGNNFVVKADDVRYGYDSIFGAGTYKDGQEIFGVCGGKLSYTYDANSNQYIAPAPACGGTSVVYFAEELLKVEKSSNQLKYTSALGWLSSEKQGLYASKNDAQNGNNALINSTNENDAKSYIKDNFDKFDKYVYTFEIDSNGFYKYVGYEKIS